MPSPNGYNYNWRSYCVTSQFRQSFSLNNFSIYTSIVRNHLFTPPIIDGAFDVWVKRGITTLRDLFIDNTFKSFDQLVLKFNLPRSHFFRFLPIRSFISTSSTYFPSQPPSFLLDSVLKLDPGHKWSIGTIYSLLNSYNLEPLHSLRNQWEGDLAESLGQDTLLLNLSSTYNYPVLHILRGRSPLSLTEAILLRRPGRLRQGNLNQTVWSTAELLLPVSLASRIIATN